MRGSGEGAGAFETSTGAGVDMCFCTYERMVDMASFSPVVAVIAVAADAIVLPISATHTVVATSGAAGVASTDYQAPAR